jgi:hypothetical protein
MRINSCGAGQWRVTIQLGRDSAGKIVYHGMTITGAKRDAQAYADWVQRQAVEGQAFASISQSELRALQKLEAKAAQFRGRLLAAVKAGAKVEPGALKLEYPTGK